MGKVITLNHQKNMLRVATDAMRARLAAFLGNSHQGERNLYQVFGYPLEVTTEDLYGMYLRNDVANRIITSFASATWRETPIIRDEAGDSAEEGAKSFSPFVNAVEDFFDKHRCISYLSRADKLQGIGRFGVILLGFRDGLKLSEPLQEGRRAPLLYIQPYSELQTQVTEWEVNENHPRFGKPKFYTLQQGGLRGQPNVQTKSIRVHWSRVIHLAENLDSNDVYAVPRLLPVYNRMKDLEKVMGGGSEAFWLNARPGMALAIDKEAQVDEDTLKDMKTQINEFEHQLRRVLTLQGVTTTQFSASNLDPGPIVDKLLDLIAGTVKIPKRILIGSERGELSSEQDENNWAATIDERRMHFATPFIIQPFITKLIQTQNIPQPEGNWWTEWPGGTALGPEAQARIGQTRAATLASYLSVPGAETVVPVPEFRTDFLGLTPETEYDDPLLLEEPLPEDELVEETPPDDGGDDEQPVDEEVRVNYDPDQPRDDDGQFGSGPGSGGGGDDGGSGDIEIEAKPRTNATTPRTLYVRRDVLNGKAIQDWAKSQGFKTTLAPDDMHVTIAYSRTPVDWMKIGAEYVQRDSDGDPLKTYVIPEGGPRVIEEFGGGKCVVLCFSDHSLQWRHDWVKSCGARWEHADFSPHITLTYQKGDVDLDGIEPYQGEIVLGPEVWETIEENWSDGLKENSRAKQIVQKRARAADNRKRSKDRATGRDHRKSGKGRRPSRTNRKPKGK